MFLCHFTTVNLLFTPSTVVIHNNYRGFYLISFNKYFNHNPLFATNIFGRRNLFVVGISSHPCQQLRISTKPLIKVFFFFAGTIFLCFTLNAFCSFYLLAMKSFTIFQLIEKAHWVLLLLSAFGVFSLCFSTESTNKAITDCATLLNSTCSHDALNINHKVEVRMFQ